MTEGTREGVVQAKPEVEKKKGFAERFFSRWRMELKRAGEAINESDRQAREKLATLNADVLRRAGFRQTAYGVALTALHAASAGFGASLGMIGGGLTGGLGGAAIGAIGGALGTIETGPGVAGGALIGAGLGATGGAWAGAIGGSVLGRQIGVELAGFVYHKFIRKLDPELLPLSKVDWIVGQLPFVNPPIIGGIRNMFEGFFGLAAKREELAVKTAPA